MVRKMEIIGIAKNTGKAKFCRKVVRNLSEQPPQGRIWACKMAINQCEMRLI